MKRKTAWIIGTGPSLNNIDVSRLKNEHTITFNRAYVAFEDWGFDPTYYLAIDSNDMRAMYKDINSLITGSRVKCFFLAHLTDNEIHGPESFQDNDKKDDLFLKNKNVYFIHQGHHGLNGTKLVHRANKVFSSHDPNAGIMGLKVLYALGYNEVAFVGCDARYKDDEESNKYITKLGREYISHADYDVNHFRNDYFGKGMRFGKPNEQMIISLWRQAKYEIDKKADFNVYSCTENSNLNDFYQYIPFNDFLDGKRE